MDKKQYSTFKPIRNMIVITQKYGRAYRRLSTLCRNYPFEPRFKLEFAKLLLKIDDRNPEKARDLLEELVGSEYDVHAKEALLKLNIKENQFKEAEDILKDYSLISFITQDEAKKCQIYMDHMRGYEDKNTYNWGYFQRQLLQYDPDYALSHIKAHLYDDKDKEVQSVFFSEVDILALFENINSILPELKEINNGVVDKYTIDVGDLIGVSKGGVTSKLVVVTICNTTDILTMYPVLSGYESPDREKPKLMVKEIK